MVQAIGVEAEDHVTCLTGLVGGRLAGDEGHDVLELLGKEETLKRIRKALGWASLTTKDAKDGK